MGNYIAGIFSVPKYKSENITSLPFTVNDGMAMKELFIKHFGTDESNIISLGNNNNQEVQRTDILRNVRYISRIAEPEDTLIFYFSGHGFSDGNIGYLATFETDRDFPSDTCISIPRIKEELKNSKAKRKMLIIDSCHSGIGAGKNLPSQMSKDFEESLFANLSEGWVVFSSCKRNEESYFLEDKFMSVFSFYLIEGLKGNADSNGDSIITLEDLNKYVTKKVLNWAVKNNKFQTPNINMEFAGMWKFAIKNPEISEPLSMEPEIGITERSAQSIVLTSQYESNQWEDYGEEVFEVSADKRKKDLFENKKQFIGHLLGIMTRYNYCKPSQITIREKDLYDLPFGVIVNTSNDIFKYKFKLMITKDLGSPTIANLFNVLDKHQDKLNWNSIEYMFNGNFDFDIVAEIIKEKEYSILEYQPEGNSYMRITPVKETEIWNRPGWTICLINTQEQANLKISAESGLEREFFQTIPIADFIEIFSSSLKNVNM